MKTSLVITVTCPDRPGIVERITEILADCSANWEESRMARLGGDFAGIVKIAVAEEKAAELTEALGALADEQMTVTVKVAQPAATEPPEGSVLYELHLTGADHEGIVHAVSRYLVDQGINVENMVTEVRPAPMSASPLFYMEAQIKVPPPLSLDALRTNLLPIGEQHGVDIEVMPCRE